MVQRSIISLLASIPLALGAVHESISGAPHVWTRSGEPQGGELVTLQIGLQQQNLEQLESRLYDVSTPSHPDYGKHLAGAQVDALVRPKADSHAVVTDWLQREGVTALHSDGDWVNFACAVDRANALLDADFAHYVNEHGESKLRTTRYSIPDDLIAHIDLIHPTTYFGRMSAHAPAPRIQIFGKPEAVEAPFANQSCEQLITPACLKQLYNVGDYKPDPKSGSKVAFSSFLNQSARYEDLALFEKAYQIPSQNLSRVILINGGVDNQTLDSDNRAEANLDAQTIVGVSHPLPVTEYITAGSPPFIPNLDEPTINTNEPYLEFYTYLLAQPDAALPQVLSNSYGDDEQTVPLRYARRVCNQIMQLTARGVSVLESSGDTGVGAACRANDGSDALQFTPQFPASCPYVTAVGGTQAFAPEVGWTGSGGGFSNYFPRPAYQQAAVQAYLDQHVSAATKAYYTPFVNFTGRGFPDVAAHSDDPRYVRFPSFTLLRSLMSAAWQSMWTTCSCASAAPRPRRPRSAPSWPYSTTRACAPGSPRSASLTRPSTPPTTRRSRTSRRATARAAMARTRSRACRSREAASSPARAGTRPRGGIPSPGGGRPTSRNGRRRCLGARLGLRTWRVRAPGLMRRRVSDDDWCAAAVPLAALSIAIDRGS